LVTSHKKGISSIQLGKDINVTQKTAWFMLQRIRFCFGMDDQLNGEVEVDETYVGGRLKNRSNKVRKQLHKDDIKRGSFEKTPILGMLERGGKLKCKVLTRAYSKEIMPIMIEGISKDAHIISDGYSSYRPAANLFSGHSVVDHSTDQFVNGTIHTNSIEGFWSLLKRGILGIYHFTSKKHLQMYVDEFTFRYNTRHSSETGRFNEMLSNTEHRLTYKNLING